MSGVRMGHQTENETTGWTEKKQQVCKPVAVKIAENKKKGSFHPRTPLFSIFILKLSSRQSVTRFYYVMELVEEGTVLRRWMDDDDDGWIDK